MKKTLQGTTTLFAILALAHGAVGEVPSLDRAWSFESDKADSPPAGFSFSKSDAGKPGRWIVKVEAGAPSAKQVLAQLDGDDTDDRFLMAVADTPEPRDLKLSVRCKAVTGKVDCRAEAGLAGPCGWAGGDV
jgi:hypothetical protein